MRMHEDSTCTVFHRSTYEYGTNSYVILSIYYVSHEHTMYVVAGALFTERVALLYSTVISPAPATSSSLTGTTVVQYTMPLHVSLNKQYSLW